MNKILWFYGLSGSGKTTAAKIAHRYIAIKTHKVIHLDADELRSQFWPELLLTYDGRLDNVKRITGLIKLLCINENVIILVSASTPYAEQRTNVLQTLPNVIFIYVNTPLNVCEKRKPFCYGDNNDKKVIKVDTMPYPKCTLDGSKDTTDEIEKEIKSIINKIL